MDELFALFGIPLGNWRALFLAFDKKDQALMRAGTFSPRDPFLKRARMLLERALPRLEGDAKMEAYDMLWLYYHHSITWALSAKGNFELARTYAIQATKYHLPHNPNCVTVFLYLYLMGRQRLALKWAAQTPAMIRCTHDQDEEINPDRERIFEFLIDFKARGI